MRAVEPGALLLFSTGLLRFDAPEDWLAAPRALDTSLRQALLAAGPGKEELRLIEVNLNSNSLAGMSQINLARTLAIYHSGAGGYLHDRRRLAGFA